MTPDDPHRSPKPRAPAGRGGGCLTWMPASNTMLVRKQAAAVTLGDRIALNSDASHRGLSASAGRPAAASDVHTATADGMFAGSFATTPDRAVEPGVTADLDGYLRRRCASGGLCSTQLTPCAPDHPGGHPGSCGGSQESGAPLSCLDLWPLAGEAVPGAARHVQSAAAPGTGTEQPVTAAACVAATQLPWRTTSRLLLGAPAGGCFEHDSAGTGSCEPGAPEVLPLSSAYAHGDAGTACLRRRLHVDYFPPDGRAAARPHPCPAVNQHVAATLSWGF
jgi:hypothetical protein